MKTPWWKFEFGGLAVGKRCIEEVGVWPYLKN